MLQVRGPILYFLLLVLGIPFDLGPNASYKQGRFSKTLLEKGLEFVPRRGDGIVTFNLSFVLLPAEVNPVLEERGCKGDAFVACDSGHIKMVLTLSTEIIVLYMQASIIKVGVSGLEGSISGGDYLDFSDVFSEEEALVLPKITDLNQHAIELQESQHPPYEPIYSLGPIELETLKT